MEKEMSNVSIFEEDAGALQVKNEDLSSVGALAKRAKELEKEIHAKQELSAKLDELEKKLLVGGVNILDHVIWGTSTYII
jgi:hypothetical protein